MRYTKTDDRSQFKVGDKVLVWSLQSFYGGGFLYGEPAVVSQDTPSRSLFIAVIRNINGEQVLDTEYEVYPQQLRHVSNWEWLAKAKLELITFKFKLKK